MKVVIISYDDSVDLSSIVKGAEVSVKSGENEISGGVVYTNVIEFPDPPPAVSPDHTHPLVAGVTGPPVEP